MASGPDHPSLRKEPILRVLTRLSIPIIIAQVGQLAYNITDTLWVGRLGAAQLAAISFSFPVVFMVFSLGTGFSAAGNALVAQYTGAEKKREAGHAAAQALLFAVSLSVVLSAVGLLAGRFLFSLMGASEEVLPLAWSYFRIICAGIPLMFVYFIFQAVMRAAGDAVTPMKIKLLTVAVNVVLDPLLIFGVGPFPELGIAGAAWATVASRLAAAALGVYILFFSPQKQLEVKFGYLKPHYPTFLKLVSLGVPAAAGGTAMSIARTVMTGLVASFGTPTVAAWGVVNRITSMVRMPAMGVAEAATVLVGQHVGAREPDEGEKTAWKAVQVVLMVLAAVVLAVFMGAGNLVGIFNGNPEVVSIGSEYLRIVVFAYLFLAVQQVLCGALRGAGNTAESAGIRLLTQWAFQIPLAYLLAREMGRPGVWWAILISYAIGGLVSALWFRRGTWKESVIAEDVPVSEGTRSRADLRAAGRG